MTNRLLTLPWNWTIDPPTPPPSRAVPIACTRSFPSQLVLDKGRFVVLRVHLHLIKAVLVTATLGEVVLGMSVTWISAAAFSVLACCGLCTEVQTRLNAASN